MTKLVYGSIQEFLREMWRDCIARDMRKRFDLYRNNTHVVNENGVLVYLHCSIC